MSKSDFSDAFSLGVNHQFHAPPQLPEGKILLPCMALEGAPRFETGLVAMSRLRLAGQMKLSQCLKMVMNEKPSG
jgi:hypothetical protein